MGKTDPRVDLYLDNAADFAQPILGHLRELIHTVCPDVQETIKWGSPHFGYPNGNLCLMAAFKNHASFGFWLGAKMEDPDGILTISGEQTGMGQLGKLRSLSDLPSDEVLTRYLKQAMQLAEQGVRPTPKREQQPVRIPDYFQAELRKNETTHQQFQNFSQSCQREYVQWLEEAKTEGTRTKRMDQALEWIAEGKIRNWKYVRKSK